MDREFVASLVLAILPIVASIPINQILFAFSPTKRSRHSGWAMWSWRVFCLDFSSPCPFHMQIPLTKFPQSFSLFMKRWASIRILSCANTSEVLNALNVRSHLSTHVFQYPPQACFHTHCNSFPMLISIISFSFLRFDDRRREKNHFCRTQHDGIIFCCQSRQKI